MAPTDDEKRKVTETTPTKKRVNKPLIEKRRRERINECLNQLQTLISQLDKDKLKVGRPAKLEKADILEMTVDFVRKTKTTVQVLPKEEPDIHEQSYKAGYKQCMNEIKKFCKDNAIPVDLKAALDQKFDLKFRDMKTTEMAVDLSIKSDKKETLLTEQMQEFAKSSPAIQPKGTPVVSSAPNSVQMAPQVQIIQKPTYSNEQVTVVCQKEPPTYVLVPTAALCQSIQIPSASQGFPVIVQNGTSSFELINKSNNFGKNGHLVTGTNMTQNNHGQILMFPNPPGSLPMISTSNVTSGNFSSIYKQPSLPSFVPASQFSKVSMPCTNLLTLHAQLPICSPEKRDGTLSIERPLNEPEEQNERNNPSQSDPMWRPW